jgi:alkyldihydroxyacetonephosphate synthase
MTKWWGWGDPQKTFPMDEKPHLWSWIKNILDLTEDDLTSKPVARPEIVLPLPQINEIFLKELSAFLHPNQIFMSDHERLTHSYGKSYPNLFYARQGVIKKSPDLVIYPKSHEEVEKIVKLASNHNICLIPFGGGTNIVGGIDPRNSQQNAPHRSVVTLDLKKMNQLISIDPISQIAVLQTGALGPLLEENLQKQGWSLGHYPDSFEYSTLGGWLATRSAGMQSDAYGKIEDMLVSLKMVTPTGTLTTKATPATSAGPNLNGLVVGSEGTLGVITEATMRIHKSPNIKNYQGFLFPSFEKGVEAIQECLHTNWIPSMIRLQDAGETQLAFQMKGPKGKLETFIQKQLKQFLSINGFAKPFMMLVGFEGNSLQTKITAKEAIKILKKHRGFSLGKSVGKTWSKDKFNIPYLRDYMMDYGVMVDVAETAALWSQLLHVYNKTLHTIQKLFQETHPTGAGYVGCHISHTYKTGACLYFTYATKQVPQKELEQYYHYKKSITENFLHHGATLTHHHAVGYEHAPWLEKELSAHGVKTFQALKNALDPKNICNPGKIFLTETEQKLGFFGIDTPEMIYKSHAQKQKITGQKYQTAHENTID